MAILDSLSESATSSNLLSGLKTKAEFNINDKGFGDILNSKSETYENNYNDSAYYQYAQNPYEQMSFNNSYTESLTKLNNFENDYYKESSNSTSNEIKPNDNHNTQHTETKHTENSNTEQVKSEHKQVSNEETSSNFEKEIKTEETKQLKVNTKDKTIENKATNKKVEQNPSAITTGEVLQNIQLVAVADNTAINTKQTNENANIQTKVTTNEQGNLIGKNHLQSKIKNSDDENNKQTVKKPEIKSDENISNSEKKGIEITEGVDNTELTAEEKAKILKKLNKNSEKSQTNLIDSKVKSNENLDDSKVSKAFDKNINDIKDAAKSSEVSKNVEKTNKTDLKTEAGEIKVESKKELNSEIKPELSQEQGKKIETLKTDISDKQQHDFNSSRENNAKLDSIDPTLTIDSAKTSNVDKTISFDKILNAKQTATESSILEQVKNASAEIGKSKSEVSINLNPGNLGKVQINLVNKDGALTTQILAENQQVKDALLKNIEELKQNLSEQGVKVKDVVINVQEAANTGNNNSLNSQQKSEKEQNEFNNSNFDSKHSDTQKDESAHNNKIHKLNNDLTEDDFEVNQENKNTETIETSSTSHDGIIDYIA